MPGAGSASGYAVRPRFRPRFRPNPHNGLNRGLIGWWLTTPWSLASLLVPDISGFKRHAVASGDGVVPTPVLPGRLASWGSLDFDGTDDFLQSGCPGVPGTGPRSIAFWFQTTDTATTNKNFAVSYGSNSGSAFGEMINLSVENGVVFLRVGSGATSWSSGLNDGKWHHVVWTCPNGATVGDTRCFVDGADLGLGSGVRVINTQAGPGTYINVRIGQSTGWASDPFDGGLNDVRIYNWRLTQDAAIRLYRQSLPGNRQLLASSAYAFPAIYRTADVQEVWFDDEPMGTGMLRLFFAADSDGAINYRMLRPFEGQTLLRYSLKLAGGTATSSMTLLDEYGDDVFDGKLATLAIANSPWFGTMNVELAQGSSPPIGERPVIVAGTHTLTLSADSAMRGMLELHYAKTTRARYDATRFV